MTKTHSTQSRPTQVWPENYRRGAVKHSRTRRRENVSVVTSSFGGKLVPLKMVPLLREDGVVNSQVRVTVQMAETSDMLLNPVRVSAMAYLVPRLAFERFQDMGTIDRSYNGQPEVDASVVPWFDTMTWTQPPPGQQLDSNILKVLGLHSGDGDTINTDYIEAYNAVWNYIAMQRSVSLTERSKLDMTLAPAFWEHTQMKHVVPTFDAALVEGAVPISFTGGGMLPLKSGGTDTGTANRRVPALDNATGLAIPPTDPSGYYDWGPDSNAVGGIFAELAASDVQLSLANIEQAKETRAWAKIRQQYQGMSDDWMIDQLLQGIRLNDESLKQPILMDHADTIVGMNERYATDGANLDKSVADGNTTLTLNMRAPALQTGGVIVICGQVLPEMVYERQRDYYMKATKVEDLPNRTADELDPQPVESVYNGEVDESHSLPTDLFGYAPLNHKWVRQAPNVGGKYYRPDPAAIWDENRNRIWATDVANPTLGPDFYLSSTVSHEVFADTNSDPFEWWLTGEIKIDGLTFFGPTLREANDDYDAVQSQVPADRLKGDGTDV